ncbi:MAG: hypothetical protein V4480_00375 [Patescibacteria group bacterium]
MNLTKRTKLIIGVIVAILLIIVIAYLTRNRWKPLPVMTTYIGSAFTFSYPRANHLEEYSSDVVSVQRPFGDTYYPLVEVVRYKSDPDVKLPSSFEAYIKQQAVALCGTDGSVESITCTGATTTPYVNAQGIAGEKLSLTLVRKNLTTGTSTTTAFEPIYVFNTTPVHMPSGESLRYQAIFIYPSLAAFVAGSSTPALESQIIDSLSISGGVTHEGQ